MIAATDCGVGGGSSSARGAAGRLLWAAVLAMVLLTGCVRSLHPVLNDEQVVMDDALAGDWVSEDGKQSFQATANAEAKQYAVAYRDGDGKTGRFVVRLGKVGDLLLAEVRPEDPPDTSDVYRAHLVPLYSFLILQPTKLRLSMSLMSQEWLLKYLEAHPGELKIAGRDKDYLFITSPTADLQTFILRHWKDAGAMEAPVVFVRPGDPTRPGK